VVTVAAAIGYYALGGRGCDIGTIAGSFVVGWACFRDAS
jgi:hypothetical protein